MIKRITQAFLFISFCVLAAVVSLKAQDITKTEIPLAPPTVVNFTELAKYDLDHPPVYKQRSVEQGEDREEDAIYPQKKVGSDAVNFIVKTPVKNNQFQAVSPAPSVSFNGVMSNGTMIPPDIQGAAGPTYLMETTNQQFNIYTKTGTLSKTVSISTFFSATGGRGYFDPHVIYDSNNGRFLICMAGTVSNGNGGIFLGVSLTSDPTGSWYVYSFDGIGNASDFLDFPMIGYNTNWVVVSGNDFLATGSVIAKIYVLNRASLYGGSAGSVTTFTDNQSFCTTPAETKDNTQTTLFLVQDWNGNSGGNGYMRVGTITGTASSPSYSIGTVLGVNKPWSEASLGAPQSGGNTIDAGDTRVGGNVVYINGTLWFSHSVALPASSPNHTAVDWWQIDPVALSLKQFGRIEDATASIFYYYPSIYVNSAGDALIGYCQSSSTSYASAAYSFHAATDAASTTQTPYVYKAGIANYYQTFGSGRNRWGDYTGMAVDPSNNSFWNFNEWANSNNLWGTVIANVAASVPATCGTPTGLTTSSITSSSATLSWTASAGASGYNIQYRASGTTTWSTGTSTTASFNVTGLSASTPYEWQVNTICPSGTTAFSASATFTTLAPPCNTPGILSTSNIGNNAASFNWAAVSGAVSYNVRYRVTGTSTWTTVSSAASPYNASGLIAGTNYEWQVQTACSSGSSAYSASATFTTTGTAPCALPASLSTTNITNTSAKFNWGAVTGAVSYNVQYRLVGATTWTSANTTTNSYTTPSTLTAAKTYEWQVQTVCSGGSSAFTASTTFTTTNSCTDVYESNNSLSTARSIPNNTTIYGLISSSTDRDYFKFSTSSPNIYVMITLTNLPADYDLYIYNSSGSLLAYSTNGGTTSETIKGSVTSGATYYLRVIGYNGVYNLSTCYNLKVATSTTTFAPFVSGATLFSDNPIQSEKSFKLYPNPAKDNLVAEFDGDIKGDAVINIYNMLGQKMIIGYAPSTKEGNIINLNTSGLSKGIYIFEVENNGEVQRQKFMIDK